MRLGIHIALFFLIAFSWAGPALGQGSPGETEQDRVRAIESEERRILAEIDQLEKKIGAMEEKYFNLEQKISSTGRSMEKVELETAELKKDLAARKKYIAKRLKALYMLKDGGLLQILLEAETMSDLFRRYRFMNLILEQDERIVAEFVEKTAELKSRLAELENQKRALYSLSQELAENKKELNDKRHEMTAMLMKVHQKKQFYLAMRKARDDSHKKLVKEVIVEQADDRDEPEIKEKVWPNFAGQKGRIPRPVSGRISRAFGRGEDRIDTFATRHGLVFSVKAGAEVRAVLAGEVIYIGWLKGYGNVLIINHGQRYYTLTGGMIGVKPKVGQWVRGGEVIGYAPKGGAREKKEIYFEVRHGGQALDPAGWLGKKPAA